MNISANGKVNKVKVLYLKLLALCLLLLTITGCAPADNDVLSERTSPSETTIVQERADPSGTAIVQERAKPDTTESQEPQTEPPQTRNASDAAVDPAAIPPFASDAYIEINDNVPGFSDADFTTESFEYYSDLDVIGRCGTAYANIGQDMMPAEEREEIGHVRPSGWHTVKYDTIDGMYLYNRCHLIGYQLTGENANEKNLITGTRYMNIEGMLPFENMVADYVNDTNHHVLYRVTPVFIGDELVARGVQMEAYSVEDAGIGICFNVFVYNVQPGIDIEYVTGESTLAQNTTGEADNAAETAQQRTYILNTRSMKFHALSCSGVEQMSEANKQEYTGSREELISKGYEPCKMCSP